MLCSKITRLVLSVAVVVAATKLTEGQWLLLLLLLLILEKWLFLWVFILKSCSSLDTITHCLDSYRSVLGYICRLECFDLESHWYVFFTPTLVSGKTHQFKQSQLGPISDNPVVRCCNFHKYVVIL